MYTRKQIGKIAKSLVFSCQGPELHRRSDALARTLKDQGKIRHVSDLKLEVSRQAARLGRSGRHEGIQSPTQTMGVAHSPARTREVQVLDFQG